MSQSLLLENGLFRSRRAGYKAVFSDWHLRLNQFIQAFSACKHAEKHIACLHLQPGETERRISVSFLHGTHPVNGGGPRRLEAGTQRNNFRTRQRVSGEAQIGRGREMAPNLNCLPSLPPAETSFSQVSSSQVFSPNLLALLSQHRCICKRLVQNCCEKQPQASATSFSSLLSLPQDISSHGILALPGPWSWSLVPIGT